MKYLIEARPYVDADIEAVFDWYEAEEPGLGHEFLDELRAIYRRIIDGPFMYQDLRAGIRRALTRRFPYAVYFAVEADVVEVLAVLHTSRDPAEWQLRTE